MRSSVTRIYNDRDNFATYDGVQIRNLRLKLNNLQTDLSTIDDKVSALKFEADNDESSLEAELVACDGYRDKLCECISLMATVPQHPPDMRDTPRSLLKSPVAPLPHFSSLDGENLELFLSQFEETISKFKYTEYDKLLLLKQQITGRALLLIDSLEADRQTYTEAKGLLVSALASKPLQKFNVLKQLSSMKLGYGMEPFQYISDMRKITQSVKHLSIDISDVLQYFFFSGLNESFKSQLIVVTNNLRPTLAEINDKFFEANERYGAAQLNFKAQRSKVDTGFKSTSALVAGSLSVPDSNVSIRVNPFTNCTLCPKADHPINRCVNYAGAADKLARLRFLKGCIKCANLDHQHEQCKFRFKKHCNLCSLWHFTFLCPNNNFPVDSKSRGQNSDDLDVKFRKTQTSIVATNFYHGNSNIDSVLSTFSCLVSSFSFDNADGSGQVRVRGLRDTGSQSNFICEHLLTNYNHEVLEDNISLVINGINESKSYQCKLVKMNLKLGDCFQLVEMLTLPKINISLRLPGLSTIVAAFTSKGYYMADRDLVGAGDCIGNFDLILGANAAYCFCDQTVHFGKSSVFTKTQFGTMLLGNVDQMLADLVDLPVSSEACSLVACSVETLDNSVGAERVSDSPYKETFTLAINYLGFPMSSSDSPVLMGAKSCEIREYPLSLNNHNSVSESLDRECSGYLNKDISPFNESLDEVNLKLVQFLLSNTVRAPDGRLIMPLLWNGKVKHLLARNYNLAKSVLSSNFKKLSKNNTHLQLMNANILDLESNGIIERVPNLSQFLDDNPTCSFLAHMPVIRLNKETTKCRMVFLSNLSEKLEKQAISHNQAMYAGPCINQKLTTAFLLLRFDPKVLCFDLKKAFLQIELPKSDQNKLLFLWYRNVDKKDFTIQAYRNIRLSFGLRCSPSILMVGLYRILMLDTEHDTEQLKQLKRLIYGLIYMDNGAVTMGSSDNLVWAYNQLNSIFNPYQFHLQQFYTNDSALRSHIGDESGSNVELFGLNWNIIDDTLCTNNKNLDVNASSKRTILRSVASNFDPYNFEGPIMNRARLFLHGLQTQTKVGWDQKISPDERREWLNICKQVNSSPSISISRFVGNRADSYRLVAFTDSSKLIYGTTIYIQNILSNVVTFLLAKNRIVNKQLESKSIPSLELMGILLGAETLRDLRNDLAGPQSVCPIIITEIIESGLIFASK